MASQSRKPEFSSNVVPFDPLKYAKKLEEAGFTREQAEVQAETFFGIVNENLVTKRDLKELENQLIQTIKESESKTALELENVRRDIKELENKTALEIENVRHDIENVRRDIKELESNTKIQMEVLRRDLKIWFGSMLVTVIVAFSTLLTVLPHLIQ
jgi:hypothetical protein